MNNLPALPLISIQSLPLSIPSQVCFIEQPDNDLSNNTQASEEQQHTCLLSELSVRKYFKSFGEHRVRSLVVPRDSPLHSAVSLRSTAQGAGHTAEIYLSIQFNLLAARDSVVCETWTRSFVSRRAIKIHCRPLISPI